MLLDQKDAKKILQKNKIPIAKEIYVSNIKEAEKAAKSLGYPVVLKALSGIHKTEHGLVDANLRHYNDLKDAYKKMVKNAKKYKLNVSFLVQKYETGYEIILGGKIDPQFGAVVIFGQGGTFVEINKDISLRICPITKKDALNMIDEVKFSKIFKGFRGKDPINKNKIAKIIINISRIMHSGKYKELDINPLIVSEKRCVAVDYRIIV